MFYASWLVGWRSMEMPKRNTMPRTTRRFPNPELAVWRDAEAERVECDVRLIQTNFPCRLLEGAHHSGKNNDELRDEQRALIPES